MYSVRIFQDCWEYAQNISGHNGKSALAILRNGVCRILILLLLIKPQTCWITKRLYHLCLIFELIFGAMWSYGCNLWYMCVSETFWGQSGVFKVNYRVLPAFTNIDSVQPLRVFCYCSATTSLSILPINYFFSGRLDDLHPSDSWMILPAQSEQHRHFLSLNGSRTLIFSRSTLLSI